MDIYINNSAESLTYSGTGGTMANSATYNGKMSLVSNTTDLARIDGWVDQVRIFDKALSAAEVAALYAEGS